MLGRGGRTDAVSDLAPSADALNTFFASICTSDPSSSRTPDPPAATTTGTLVLRPVTTAEVITTICSLPQKSSEGIDGINTRLLQLSLPITAPYIRHIFNTSITTNCFPSSWKLAIISPIYKRKGSQGEPGNYRPVALLPVISRVLEKLVLKQLFIYMNEHSILSSCQHAFRKRHSTATALLEVTDQVWKSMDVRQVTTNVLLDLSKAFDKVDHTILINKLTHYGLYCDWFRSYLTGRSQAVRQLEKTSTFLSTTSGVPQGSCLGPVLFSIYTNDLPQHLASKVVMYADDTQLIASYKLADQDYATKKLQSDLDTLELYMERNKLTINAAKTQVITFGSHPLLKKIERDMANDLRIGGTTPEQLPAVTNLGVHMDTSLTWQAHINELCAKMNASLIQLARAKHLIPKADLITAIQTIALSHIHYCTTVWSTAGKSAIAPINRSIRMAERIANTTFPAYSALAEDKLRALRTTIDSRVSSEYINTCLLINQRGHAIKPLTKTNNGQKQLAFRCIL